MWEVDAHPPMGATESDKKESDMTHYAKLGASQIVKNLAPCWQSSF
jgi:hypothetical protein